MWRRSQSVGLLVVIAVVFTCGLPWYAESAPHEASASAQAYVATSSCDFTNVAWNVYQHSAAYVNGAIGQTFDSYLSHSTETNEDELIGYPAPQTNFVVNMLIWADTETQVALTEAPLSASNPDYRAAKRDLWVVWQTLSAFSCGSPWSQFSLRVGAWITPDPMTYNSHPRLYAHVGRGATCLGAVRYSTGRHPKSLYTYPRIANGSNTARWQWHEMTIGDSGTATITCELGGRLGIARATFSVTG